MTGKTGKTVKAQPKHEAFYNKLTALMAEACKGADPLTENEVLAIISRMLGYYMAFSPEPMLIEELVRENIKSGAMAVASQRTGSTPVGHA